MSSLVEAYEADMMWLHSKITNPTWDQEESFAERVAIAIIDGKVDEQRARELALKSILGEQ